MARERVPANVRNELVNRLALYLTISNDGADDSPRGLIAETKRDTVVWTLGVVGFTPDVIAGIENEARKTAGFDPKAAPAPTPAPAPATPAETPATPAAATAPAKNK